MDELLSSVMGGDTWCPAAGDDEATHEQQVLLQTAAQTIESVSVQLELEAAAAGGTTSASPANELREMLLPHLAAAAEFGVSDRLASLSSNMGSLRVSDPIMLEGPEASGGEQQLTEATVPPPQQHAERLPVKQPAASSAVTAARKEELQAQYSVLISRHPVFSWLSSTTCDARAFLVSLLYLEEAGRRFDAVPVAVQAHMVQQAMQQAIMPLYLGGDGDVLPHGSAMGGPSCGGSPSGQQLLQPIPMVEWAHEVARGYGYAADKLSAPSADNDAIAEEDLGVLGAATSGGMGMDVDHLGCQQQQQQQRQGQLPQLGGSHWEPGQLAGLRATAAEKRLQKAEEAKRKQQTAVKVALNAEKRWRR